MQKNSIIFTGNMQHIQKIPSTAQIIGLRSLSTTCALGRGRTGLIKNGIPGKYK